MEFKNIKAIIGPLISKGQEWQYIDINGVERKPRLYFSSLQLLIIAVSIAVLFKLRNGISDDIIGYIMGAFSISVSLFMSLLVSIFDKFENTEFVFKEHTETERDRLVQKKNFFKRFISITSYLVVLSILIIVLCSFTYIFDLNSQVVSPADFTASFNSIDFLLTLKNFLLMIYRVSLNYFLLNYLMLTLFITGSAFDYYISEMNSRKVPHL